MGIVKKEVIHIINLLREERILADNKYLNAFIKKKSKKNNSLTMLKDFWQMEKFFLTVIDKEEKILHIKELNEQAEEFGCKNVSLYKIKILLNFWTIKNLLKRRTMLNSRNHIAVMSLYDQETLAAKIERRNQIASSFWSI